jgi:hypothetical protein
MLLLCKDRQPNTPLVLAQCEQGVGRLAKQIEALDEIDHVLKDLAEARAVTLPPSLACAARRACIQAQQALNKVQPSDPDLEKARALV